MSKFIKIVEKYSKGLVLEQDIPPPPQSNNQQELSSPPSELPPSEQYPGDETDELEYNPDVPASIATMGNLLKKALTMKISDDDKYKISQLPEVNEKNADAVINKLLTIMKTYSADIDIDNNTTTST